MAKISAYTELSTVSASDVVPIVSGGTTQKIQQTNLIPDATTAIKGKVELATDAETITGTDTERAVTPSNITGKIDTDGTLAGNSDTRIASQKAVKTYGDRALNTTLNIHPIYAPQGFLINGKISVTVSANDLIVAIKTLAGTDPSATDPVYCRIGDTVRSITSALSVTAADATNWCNAGGSELATKEIDYFAYLGYNATDGVVIGFSRIPYARQYSEFSTVSNSERFCKISTITNAAATDYYEVIGRFAATLSAGAGYTWTVPTFTPANLIQEPIHHTRPLNWTPTYSASGSMTFTSVNTDLGKYVIMGKLMLIKLACAGTTGGAANTALKATFPFQPEDGTGTNLGGGAYVNDNAARAGFWLYGSSVISVSKYDNSVFDIGASRGFTVSATFEID